MEALRFCIFFLTCYFLNVNRLSGFSCDYSECSCMNDMITCVEIVAPRFKFRATVTMMYMDNVQIINLKDLLKNLPNLRCLTLMNMRYFNCKWLRDITEDIIVRTNMCESKESSTYPITAEYVSYEKEKKIQIHFQKLNLLRKVQYILLQLMMFLIRKREENLQWLRLQFQIQKLRLKWKVQKI